MSIPHTWVDGIGQKKTKTWNGEMLPRLWVIDWMRRDLSKRIIVPLKRIMDQKDAGKDREKLVRIKPRRITRNKPNLKSTMTTTTTTMMTVPDDHD